MLQIKNSNYKYIIVFTIITILLGIITILGGAYYLTKQTKIQAKNSNSSNSKPVELAKTNSTPKASSIIDSSNSSSPTSQITSQKDICNLLPNWYSNDPFQTTDIKIDKSKEFGEILMIVKKTIYKNYDKATADKFWKVYSFIEQTYKNEGYGDISTEKIEKALEQNTELKQIFDSQEFKDINPLINKALEERSLSGTFGENTNLLTKLTALVQTGSDYDDNERILTQGVSPRLNYYYVIMVIAPYDSDYLEKSKLPGADTNKLFGQKVAKTLWLNRYAYGLNVGDAKTISLNNYLQLQICAIKQDFEDSDIDNARPNEYASNYILDGITKEQKSNYLSNLIKLGNTQSQEEYIKTYLNFYNKQFGIIKRVTDSYSTTLILPSLLGGKKIDDSDKNYTPEPIDYSSTDTKNLIEIIKSDYREVIETANYSVEGLFSNPDVLSIKQTELKEYRNCLTQSQITYTESGDDSDKKYKLIYKITDTNYDKLTLEKQQTIDKCKAQSKTRLDNLYRDYYLKSHPKLD